MNLGAVYGKIYAASKSLLFYSKFYGSEVLNVERIKMTTPLVEMDGDEMTRIIWKMIKDELLYPFIDLKTEYYDLGLPERERTKDKVTFDAAYANQK